MTQHLFNGESTSDKAQLDANFTQIYQALRLDSPQTWTGSTYAASSAISQLAAGEASWGLQCSDSNNTRAKLFANNTSWGLWTDGSALKPWVLGGFTSEWMRHDGTGLMAGADNTMTNGSATRRWSVVYAGTGTINTSDAREKTTVAPLTAAELAAAQQLVASIGTYQWLSAMQAKGADARKHVGMTVQDAVAIMTANGLDPMAYGFICHDAWDEERDADGNVTQVAGDRYGFRPDELGMFIARGVAASLAAINARLSAAGL